MGDVVPTGARLLDQFYVAEVTAYALLKINFLSSYSAGRAL